MHAALETILQERHNHGLLRQRRILPVADPNIVNFASSDYLGLAKHPKVIQSFKDAVDRFGVGSGGSAMVCGYHDAHRALEEKVAEFVGMDKVLLFPSGYMANIGIIHALSGQVDMIYHDRNNHASLIDGVKLSGLPMRRYLHGDCRSLQQRLRDKPEPRALIVTESVFSMEGDRAPLMDLSRVIDPSKDLLMIDDAHGFGVLGGGRGCLAEFAFAQPPIYMATFSKALGGAGAFVAGDRLWMEYILQFARTYTYTTAMPPAIAWANKAAIEVIEQSHVVNNLWENIDYFSEQVQKKGIHCEPNQHAIQSIIIGDPIDALAAHERLHKQGIFVGLMRPPSVPGNRSLLRIGLSATHTKKHIDKLLTLL